MSHSKQQRGYSGTAWQPVVPERARVERRRSCLVLRVQVPKVPARREIVEELPDDIERKTRQR